MAVRHFDCGSCNAFGKIQIKGDEYEISDIVYCPICGADIDDEEDETEDEE